MTDRESGTPSPSPQASPQGFSWKNRLGDWSVYAAAAGAALATATSADADIVYSGLIDLTVSVPVSNTGVSHKTFNVDGMAARLGLFGGHYIYSGPRYRYHALMGREAIATVNAFGLNFVRASREFSPNPIIKRYALSEPILATSLVMPNTGSLLRFDITNTLGLHIASGSFERGTVGGFIGFTNPGNHTKGWIQVEVFDRNHDGFVDQAEVIDFAYNSTPGGPINAGQTQSATPEPGSLSLALLGAGAAGLMAWRRRKKAA